MVLVSWWSVPVLVLVSVLHEAASHGLLCTNDFFNTVTCTWQRPSVGPGLDCWVSGVKNVRSLRNSHKHMTRSCRLTREPDHDPGCSFIFEDKEFYNFEKLPNISVMCNGTLMDVILDYSPQEHIKLQPPAAPHVNSSANGTWIWWSPGGPVSDFLESLDFEVQVKQKNQNWEEARTLSTQQREVWISAEDLDYGDGQVRVRVKPGNQHSLWSSWSPTTSWVGARERPGPGGPAASGWQLEQTLLTTGLMLTGFVLTVSLLHCCTACRTRGPLTGKLVPSPSRFFHTLNSVHGGNLKTWLNPLTASPSFFTSQSCDLISPVQVRPAWDAGPPAPPSFYPSPGSDTSGIVDNSSSSSWFSNMGYFLSSSGSGPSEPGLAYFSHQGHVQSTAHESERRPSSVDLEEVSDEHSSPLLIIPLTLPVLVRPPSPPAPHPPPGASQVPSDVQQVEPPGPADSGSETWPVASSMSRSSSMPVEPSRTGYLTLKELQMTFSNKSI